MNFFRTPFILPLIYPSLVWRIKTSEKELYLTLDDGPVPGPTEFALDTLKKFHVRATFFCIGDNVRKHPEIFRRIIREGHRVGNHTFHHLNGWSNSAARYREDVNACARELNANSAVTSNQQPAPLLRPPYGRIKRAQIHSLQDYKIIMWDVLTFDYERRLSPQTCLKGSVKAVRPGSIIVFHDSLKAEKNMTYVLPRFLEHFSSLGYAFKTL